VRCGVCGACWKAREKTSEKGRLGQDNSARSRPLVVRSLCRRRRRRPVAGDHVASRRLFCIGEVADTREGGADRR